MDRLVFVAVVAPAVVLAVVQKYHLVINATAAILATWDEDGRSHWGSGVTVSHSNGFYRRTRLNREITASILGASSGRIAAIGGVIDGSA